MLGLFRKKKEKTGPFVYLSELPCFTTPKRRRP